MFSGGDSPVPTSTDQALDLRGQMTGQVDVVTDANQNEGVARNGVEDAGSAVGDARSDKAEANQEANHQDSQVRGKQQALEQSIEQLEMYVKNIENEMKRTEPDMERVKTLFEQAAFEYQVFLRELKRTIDEGCQELYAEQQNKAGELWRAICALIGNMGRAMIADLVGRLSASLGLNFASFFRPRSAPDKGYERTQAGAITADRTVKTQQANISKRAESNPHEELVAKKTQDLTQSQGEKQAADSTLVAAEGAEQAARNAQQGARDVYDQARANSEIAKNELNAMSRGLQQYSDNTNAEDMRQRQEAMEQRNQQNQQA